MQKLDVSERVIALPGLQRLAAGHDIDLHGRTSGPAAVYDTPRRRSPAERNRVAFGLLPVRGIRTAVRSNQVLHAGPRLHVLDSREAPGSARRFNEDRVESARGGSANFCRDNLLEVGHANSASLPSF